MGIEIWIYYVIAILVLTASPGPSVLLCMTTAVTQGFYSSVYTALGSLTAIVGILTLSFTGLGVVIANSEFAFGLIKWIGASYLIYLGYKAFTSTQVSFSFKESGESPNRNLVGNYISGFVVGASNPKAIIFFMALFPQFIDTEASLLTQYLVFVSTFAVLELTWLLTYAYFGHRASHWLLARGRAQLFNRLTGGIFVGAGILLSNTSKA